MESHATNDQIDQTETNETLDQGNDQALEAEVIEAVEDEVVKLKALADENYQKFLRVQADFDNFRRRTRQEKEELSKYAASKVIENLLPTLDNLERAVASAKQSQDAEALLKGVEMVGRLFTQVLQQEGLTAIESVGQVFDPSLHQAVMQVNDETQPDGVVVEELQKGYVLKEKVLRPAMVKVNQH